MKAEGDIADVAVVIPTLRRPESLERALRSLWAQEGVERRLREIVVVDNDPLASAKAQVRSLAEAAPWSLVWAHEPLSGVANARNAGLAATDAPLIAFLDDDEEASPQWLAALLSVLEDTGADVVFGPIRGRVPDAPVGARDYLERFFSRPGAGESGLIDRAYGCGNSLMRRETALPGAAPFHAKANETGGEDDLLFAEVAGRGGRFAWAADAWVDEHAPVHRATLSYALRRAFAYGQGPTQTAAAQGRWLSVARWMTVGVAQFAVCASTAAVLTLLRSPGRADQWDRAARGLGKTLWFPGLEPKFYGACEVKRLDRPRRT